MKAIQSVLNSLFFDNPILDCLSRRAWRRFRRWGWLLGLLPLSVFGWLAVFVAGFVLDAAHNSAFSPAILATIAGGTTAAFAVAAICVFSLGSVSPVLRRENLEALFLTQLRPEQIWAAVLVNVNRNLLAAGAFLLPALLAVGALGGIPPGIILREAGFLAVLANFWTLVFCAWALQFGFRFCGFFSAVLLAGYLVLGGIPLIANERAFPWLERWSDD